MLTVWLFLCWLYLLLPFWLHGPMGLTIFEIDRFLWISWIFFTWSQYADLEAVTLQNFLTSHKLRISGGKNMSHEEYIGKIKEASCGQIFKFHNYLVKIGVKEIVKTRVAILHTLVFLMFFLCFNFSVVSFSH